MEFITGTLDKVALANSKGNWSTYDLAFDTGENHRVLVPNDANLDLDQYKGQEVRLYRKNGNLFVAYKELLDSKFKDNNSGGGGKSNWKKGGDYKKSASARDDYWTQKYHYEVDEKDPQIAMRSLFIQCANFYQGCLPYFENQPTNTIEADKIIDEAWAKARELFVLMSRKEDDDD